MLQCLYDFNLISIDFMIIYCVFCFVFFPSLHHGRFCAQRSHAVMTTNLSSDDSNKVGICSLCRSRNCMRQQVLYDATSVQSITKYYYVLLQYYSVLQSIMQVLHGTILHYKNKAGLYSPTRCTDFKIIATTPQPL